MKKYWCDGLQLDKKIPAELRELLPDHLPLEADELLGGTTNKPSRTLFR